MDDQTKGTRKEIKARDGVTYGFGRTGIPGTFTIEAYHRDFPMPIGTVWYQFSGRHILDSLNSFVDERFRRCGVRTYLHEKLLYTYPTVTRFQSGGGTKFGIAWMKAMKFKQTDHGWIYERPKAKR